MTALSELFVTETIRDMVEEIVKRKVHIECPDNWRDKPNDNLFPSTGEAIIYPDHGDEPIGKVSWITTFDVAGDEDEGRYVEAYVSPLDLKLEMIFHAELKEGKRR